MNITGTDIVTGTGMAKLKENDPVAEVVAIRQAQYDLPQNDFVRSSGMLSSLGYQFKQSDGTVRPLQAEDIPMLMICVKLSRLSFKYDSDSTLDIAGYAKTLDQVINSRSVAIGISMMKM